MVREMAMSSLYGVCGEFCSADAAAHERYTRKIVGSVRCV